MELAGTKTPRWARNDEICEARPLVDAEASGCAAEPANVCERRGAKELFWA